MLPLKCNSNTSTNPYSLSDMELLFHFTWIKYMSARGHKTYICERCLNDFRTEDLREKHRGLCINVKVTFFNVGMKDYDVKQA
jgi:hypothetical protein